MRAYTCAVVFRFTPISWKRKKYIRYVLLLKFMRSRCTHTKTELRDVLFFYMFEVGVRMRNIYLRKGSRRESLQENMRKMGRI